MTQENKELLLKDLCTRLPYGVKVQHLSHQIPLKILSINPNGVTWVTGDKGYPFEVDWTNCKPYLFPLSSMTEEQKEELDKYFDMDTKSLLDGYKNGLRCPHTYFIVQDWYNKNHFDYRGLIPMGLANDATGLNIY